MIQSKIFLRMTIVYVRAYNKESKNIFGAIEQEEAIRNFASKSGYNILEVFREEGESGKTFNRPAFQKMVEYIRSHPRKVKFLVVSDITRISTSRDGLRSFKKFIRCNDIKLISLAESMARYIVKQKK